MKDFIFRNDTKLFFRNDISETLAELTAGQKIMLVYGGGSIIKNGCYKDIANAMKSAGTPMVEYGDSSRELEKIEQGIEHIKAEGVTMIIGVGGASVMDSAKLMALGYYHERDLWDYVKGKSPYGLKHLPLILIPTYPSSGSENGLGAVAVDSRTGDFGTAYGIGADYAILCPKYSLTLNPEMTTYTGLVTLVQLSASVLGDRNPMSYDAGISYIKNVLKATCRLQDVPDDLDARGIIMMGASLSTSTRLGLGKEEPFAYDIYELEFLPEQLFGSSYRRSLTTIFPRFLEIMGRHHEADIKRFLRDAFGYEGSIKEAAQELVELFSRLGIPMYFDCDTSRDEVDAVPRQTELSGDEVYEIITLMKGK